MMNTKDAATAARVEPMVMLPDAIQVTVTQRHIDRSLRASMCRGPISESLSEQFPGYTCDVTKHDKTVDLISDDMVGKQYELPEIALRWLESFDRCESDGDPISFTMHRA